MEQSNIFFISHCSKDSAQALELYNLLLEIHPEWKGRIFLDCCEERPLESHEEWRARMLREVENSRYLIFITSSLEYVKEGSGWMFEEISLFQNLKVNRNNFDRGELNISYFGIFLCRCDFENALFNDPLRGSEYRRLFQRPEHLVFGDGETVSGNTERIKNKVNQIISGNDNNENVALILDKTRTFAVEKAKNDYMFNQTAIDDCLIPSTSCNENRLTFEEFCIQVQNSHIALLGNEGGCGKTSILTKMFYHYLDNADISDSQSMIPLYVDAKSLAAENHLILRHLAKNLFGEHTAMTDSSTSKNVGMLSFEFSQKRESPRYLLIIDGYNEIPESSIAKIDRELLDFLPDGRYSNVRIVVSGRHVGSNLPESVFVQITINPLAASVVAQYLKTNGLWNGKLKDSLFRILSIPMYLKMYAETSADEQVQNKADLLCAFVDWQYKKDMNSAANDEKKALYGIFLFHVLPVIAQRMMAGNSSFVLTQDELEEILVDAAELLRDTSYKRYYGRDYRELLRVSDFSEYDELDLSDLTIEYFVRTFKILRRDNDGNLDFIHQIYRDFFCAYFISEQIKRSVEKYEHITSISEKILDVDVMEFVADLLKEQPPVYDAEKDIWDYSCNERSSILSALDLIRENGGEDSAVSVANIVEMLKYARKNDLSGLDFSHLDLSRTTLQTCVFYRYDKSGRYSTSFAGSTINRENIFTEKHFDEIIAVCTNDKCVACIDTTGMIKFWERKRVVTFPIKIITDVQYSVRKMLFNRENDKIFAMTDHEIMEIPITEEFSSKAEPKIVFKTAKRLRDIMIDEKGEIFFTTYLNSFNFKSINDPNAPDNCMFYGINSGASVNDAGNRLAFGHIAGYETLKLYDYYPEDDNWKERKFGYSALLNDCIIELDEFFQSTRFYHIFPTDNEREDKRRTFFSYIQQQFEDCTHDPGRIPGLIAERCRKQLAKNGISDADLSSDEWEKFNSIVRKYEDAIRDSVNNNSLLMLISGRNVTSVSFKKGSNTLLLSCNIDYKEKLKGQNSSKKPYKNKQYDNIVLELDTDTFETRFITRFYGDAVFRAFYCGDDIIVLSKYHVTIYDQNGSDVVHVTTCPKTIQTFITPKNKNTFYAIAYHFIYEMDENLNCVKCFSNEFYNVNISYIVNSEGQEFLARKAAFKNADSGEPIKVLDLSQGRYYDIFGGEFDRTNPYDIATLGSIGVKVCFEKVVLFENEIKKGIIDLPYKLFVCGCDFRGVKGNIAEPGYIQTLYRMGAVTDEVGFPEITVEVSDEDFVPSSAELVLPEGIETRYVPYSSFSGMSLEEDCYFNDTVGGNNLYIQKTWALINRGSYLNSELEEADYLILEWINSLKISYAGMITELVDAGIIEKPTHFRDAGKRLAGALHRTYKLIFRSQFCQYGIGKKIPIYTVCFPYGARMLKYITGVYPKNHLSEHHEFRPGSRDPKWRISIKDLPRVSIIRRTLALNQWFTLTASRYKNYIEDYSLNTIFDTDNHIRGRANIHGYIQLGDQSFFTQAFRSVGSRRIETNVVEKIERMCILSTYYHSIKRYGQQLNSLKKRPVIILIGEDLEHCRMMNDHIKELYPKVRKLYTFDTLLTSSEAFEGAGNYFEFVDDAPYSVKLDELF